jgi:hypothetical protein
MARGQRRVPHGREQCGADDRLIASPSFAGLPRRKRRRRATRSSRRTSSSGTPSSSRHSTLDILCQHADIRNVGPANDTAKAPSYAPTSSANTN